jgi:hypothetical protein
VKRIFSFARCAASVTLLVVAWVDGAGLEFQARAMACCTHRQDCGGNLRAPDNCCERMGHGTPAKTGTLVQSSHVVALVPLGVVAPVALVEHAGFSVALSVTRLHDPPHLHTFALLI